MLASVLFAIMTGDVTWERSPPALLLLGVVHHELLSSIPEESGDLR
jgi:hypothetical protein